VQFSPLSPVTIAMFVTSFGGCGMILMKLLNVTQPLVHIPVSMLAGLAVGGLTFAFFYRVFQSTQSSSESRVNDLAGLQAEVTTSIPSEGLGEITYVSRGSRFTAPARSEERLMIATHTPVVIKKVLGNTFFVALLEKKDQA
jgi:membrane protein implicated in regulation of membrane protease activity